MSQHEGDLLNKLGVSLPFSLVTRVWLDLDLCVLVDRIVFEILCLSQREGG